jgi:hypothetical protein
MPSFLRQRLHRNYAGMLGSREAVANRPSSSNPAEVRSLEQLGRKHHFRALAGSLADELVTAAMLASVEPPSSS